MIIKLPFKLYLISKATKRFLKKQATSNHAKLLSQDLPHNRRLLWSEAIAINMTDRLGRLVPQRRSFYPKCMMNHPPQRYQSIRRFPPRGAAVCWCMWSFVGSASWKKTCGHFVWGQRGITFSWRSLQRCLIVTKLCIFAHLRFSHSHTSLLLYWLLSNKSSDLKNVNDKGGICVIP